MPNFTVFYDRWRQQYVITARDSGNLSRSAAWIVSSGTTSKTLLVSHALKVRPPELLVPVRSPVSRRFFGDPVGVPKHPASNLGLLLSPPVVTYRLVVDVDVALGDVGSDRPLLSCCSSEMYFARGAAIDLVENPRPLDRHTAPLPITVGCVSPTIVTLPLEHSDKLPNTVTPNGQGTSRVTFACVGQPAFVVEVARVHPDVHSRGHSQLKTSQFNTCVFIVPGETPASRQTFIADVWVLCGQSDWTKRSAIAVFRMFFYLVLQLDYG